MIVSFINPEIIRRVNADSNPYALINTVYDEEPNDYITNPQIVEEYQTNVKSPNYKNSYVGGTIGTSSDVDYFMFNIYGDASVTFWLTTFDNSDYSLLGLNYNFAVYKQQNKVYPSLDNSGLQALYTSSYVYVDDLYNFTCVPGTYFVKVFGVNGSYNTRFSYKLVYSINYSHNSSFNLREYQQENDNSFAVWQSDFSFLEKHDWGKEEDYLIQNHNSNGSIEHNLCDEFMWLDGFPNFEIYFWGVELRTQIVEMIEEILNGLNNDLENMEEYNRKLDLDVQLYNEAGLLFAVLSLNKSFGPIFSSLSSITTIVGYLHFKALTPKKVNSIYELIDYYNNIIYAIADNTASTGDDDFIYCITNKLKIYMEDDPLSINSKYFVQTVCNETGSRYNNYMRYESDYIYDIKQYDELGGTNYFNIYGKYYVEDAEEILENYLGG